MSQEKKESYKTVVIHQEPIKRSSVVQRSMATSRDVMSMEKKVQADATSATKKASLNQSKNEHTFHTRAFSGLDFSSYAAKPKMQSYSGMTHKKKERTFWEKVKEFLTDFFSD